MLELSKPVVVIGTTPGAGIQLAAALLVTERDQLSDADRLTLREQIDALADPDIDEDEQVRLWGRVKALAPSMMNVGRQIFVSVATAYVQRQLGI